MKGSNMPGFMPSTKLMGMSGSQNANAPGLSFILGIVDDNFGQKAIDNGWLTTSTYFNSPYTVSLNDNITFRAAIEPFNGFKIELTANRNYSQSGSSYLNVTDRKFDNYLEGGNYSISFISIGSAFEKVKFDKGPSKYVSSSFSVFKENREIISKRLADNRQAVDPDYNPLNVSPGLEKGSNGYSILSQNVLIPSFMAAYGGIDPTKVTLDRFPSFLKMMPNWRITYDGLSKIPFVKKYARSVNLNHAYKSTYNVGNYATRPDYENPDYYDVQTKLSYYRDLQNNFVPKYEISSISITEQFTPLISIDINFLNSLSTRFELKRNRNIVLSLTNNQLTENLSNEIVLGAGYKITDFKLIVRSSAGEKGVNTDLNLRGDFSIRDNKMIIRRLTDEPDQGAQGQKVLTLKFSADYMLSDKFNIRMFYDRIVNTPFVSLSYPTANTNFGFSLRFSLTQ
jgi:cell surface protein SprA